MTATARLKEEDFFKWDEMDEYGVVVNVNPDFISIENFINREKKIYSLAYSYLPLSIITSEEITDTLITKINTCTNHKDLLEAKMMIENLESISVEFDNKHKTQSNLS